MYVIQYCGYSNCAQFDPDQECLIHFRTGRLLRVWSWIKNTIWVPYYGIPHQQQAAGGSRLRPQSFRPANILVGKHGSRLTIYSYVCNNLRLWQTELWAFLLFLFINHNSTKVTNRRWYGWVIYYSVIFMEDIFLGNPPNISRWVVNCNHLSFKD